MAPAVSALLKHHASAVLESKGAMGPARPHPAVFRSTLTVLCSKQGWFGKQHHAQRRHCILAGVRLLLFINTAAYFSRTRELERCVAS